MFIRFGSSSTATATNTRTAVASRVRRRPVFRHNKVQFVLTIAMSLSTTTTTATKAANYGSMGTTASSSSNGNGSAMVLPPSKPTPPPSSTSASSMINVDKIQEPMYATHDSCINLTYEWRIKQLKTMKRMLNENRNVFQQALMKDLGRDPIEAYVGEIIQVENEVDYFIKNLKTLMEPEVVPSPAVMIPGFTHIERRPLNVPGICIIGSCNFPFQLSLRPAVGAIAAGNPTVIKPSEQAVNTCQTLNKLIPQYFDAGAFQVVDGSVAETQALLEKSWGMMVFTGSERVGKIVAEACAKTLTPTLLELGGKCPCIVDETVTARMYDNIADRIIFGKLLNAGQICVAPDTLFVHTSHIHGIQTSLLQKLKAQFGIDPKQSDLPRIVQQSHTQRLVDIIKEAENDIGCTLLCGGSKLCDVEARYVSPTIILVNLKKASTSNLRILNEEIFGPILPVIEFESRDDVISMINSDIAGFASNTPLALTVFTPHNEVFNQYTSKCKSGMAFRNDMVVHVASSHVRHGGLGTSGMGAYHGKTSYETFTHGLTVCQRPIGAIYDLNNLRCHPRAGLRGKLLHLAATALPDIPNLRTRNVLTVLGIGIFLKVFVDLSGLAVKPLLADILQAAVDYLRK